jgi:hypothetical protein
MSATPPQPAVRAFTWVPVAGRADTTDAKMMSDMPLPMPRWVIASPIHMSSAVPAVSVSTMSSTRNSPKFGTRSMLSLTTDEAAAAVVEQEDEAGRLQDRDRDREVAGPLRDLALPDRPLLLPLLELRDHHRRGSA